MRGIKKTPRHPLDFREGKPHANDIADLYASYDSQPALIKDHMYSLAARNIDAIIRGTTPMKYRDQRLPKNVH